MTDAEYLTQKANIAEARATALESLLDVIATDPRFEVLRTSGTTADISHAVASERLSAYLCRGLAAAR